MSIDITRFDADDRIDREQWDDHVRTSRGGTLFHTFDMLELIERHASADLYPFIGYKGQEPVGVFPVFELSKGGISAAFSPPPRMGIPSMGPAPLNDGHLKRRKAERRLRRFVEGCLESIDERIGPRYSRVCTSVGVDDPRPFTWNEFDASPRHTYVLDIDREPEDLKQSFSKSLRRYLDPDGDDAERFRIEERGTDAIEFIHEQVTARYEAQDRTYTVPLEFLLEAYETLPEGRLRPYVGAVDGDLASGILVFEGPSTIYYSAGGGKPDVDYPINDLLHWRIIRDARDRGIERYDLCGANTERICTYKSKFNPDLVTYYEVERGTPVMNAVSSLYRRLR
ncbi:lipid II:glycine glycyltransferase FemX [Natrinema sp. LN54]|uniref:lipid II:glycine glycyltransferase FemX n=1 Tax=Natrinema sp. LN54 TaxID=3458705 RepID=UPI00403553EB